MDEEWLICPICGRVDVTQKHIDECTDYDKIEREDNLWK